MLTKHTNISTGYEKRTEKDFWEAAQRRLARIKAEKESDSQNVLFNIRNKIT